MFIVHRKQHHFKGLPRATGSPHALDGSFAAVHDFSVSGAWIGLYGCAAGGNQEEVGLAWTEKASRAVGVAVRAAFPAAA